MSVNDSEKNSEVISELKATLENLKSEFEKTKGTNARLLDENVKHKQKYNDVRDKYDELDTIRKEKLSAEERLAESQKEIVEQARKLEAQSDNLFEMNVKSQLRKHAPDARSLEAIMGITSKKSLLQFDADNNSVTDDSVKEYVNAIREEHSYMFESKKAPVMGDGRKPENGKGFETATQKLQSHGLSKVDTNDLIGALKENWKPRASKA